MTDSILLTSYQESMKYSMRSPTSCSWRLHVRTVGSGGRGGTKTVYKLGIQIGNRAGPRNGNLPYQYNQIAPQSTLFHPQQNNMPSASPYYDQSATRFCSECGAPRQNLTSKFCSTCGQPFNI